MSSERKQIGSYRVIRVLGSGGMGTVYEAQHLKISRRVAIKLLHTEFLEQRDLAERFLNEARAVNEINHPGVIRIFDADELEDGTLYLVMELLSGQTLAEYLHQFIIKLIYLLSHFFHVCMKYFTRNIFFSPDNTSDHFSKSFRSYLLFGITPCLVRINMTFYHQAIKVKVNGSLCHIHQYIPAAAYM